MLGTGREFCDTVSAVVTVPVNKISLFRVVLHLERFLQPFSPSSDSFPRSVEACELFAGKKIEIAAQTGSTWSASACCLAGSAGKIAISGQHVIHGASQATMLSRLKCRVWESSQTSLFSSLAHILAEPACCLAGSAGKIAVCGQRVIHGASQAKMLSRLKC